MGTSHEVVTFSVADRRPPIHRPLHQYSLFVMFDEIEMLSKALPCVRFPTVASLVCTCSAERGRGERFVVYPYRAAVMLHCRSALNFMTSPTLSIEGMVQNRRHAKCLLLPKTLCAACTSWAGQAANLLFAGPAPPQLLELNFQFSHRKEWSMIKDTLGTVSSFSPVSSWQK